MFLNLGEDILTGVYKILISLVAVIYSVIGYLYQVFMVLINSKILSTANYDNIVAKVYLVLGIAMLFVIAYNFLLLVVDPDKNKGGKVVEKLLKDVLLSFILIAITPTIFDFAFRAESAILNQSIIQRIFVPSGETSSSDDLIEGGLQMAEGVFSAFFYQIDSTTGERVGTKEAETETNASTVRNFREGSFSLAELKVEVAKTGNFWKFNAFARNIAKETVNFDWFLAFLAGIYVCYILLNYCFDMAVRVIKLAFFQIIAPIAIVCKIVPNKESVFKNWYSKTIKTFLSSFIRIFILSMTIFIFNILSTNFWEGNFLDSSISMSFGVKWIAYALLIMGIITFMKQVPQLIDEIFGLNADIKLGLRDKVKAATPPGKMFTAGAMLAGAASGGMRNLTHAWSRQKAAKAEMDAAEASGDQEALKQARAKRARALSGMLFSAASGAVSGGANAAWYAADAKSRKDVAAATNKATQKVEEKRDKRESYIANQMSEGASFGDALIDFHTFRHLENAGESFKDWATGGAEQYEKATQSGKKMKQYGDAIDAAAEKLVNQNLSSSDLIQGTAADQKFYGSTEDVDRQIALFDKLSAANGGSFSIAQLEKFREQLANSEITKESFQRYDKKRKPMLSDKQLEEEFQKALLKRSKTLDDLERMSVKLRKNAKNHIVDHRNDSDGFAGIEHKDFLDVRASVDSFVLAYNMEGGTITDTETGERFGMLSKDKANISKDIKNVRDAYDHNASRARAEQAKREQQKEANK